MNMHFSDSDIAFQTEVREFVQDHMPDHIKQKVQRGLKLEKKDILVWQKLLDSRGWFTPHWPLEIGGTGWSPTQYYLFQQEMVDGYAPRLSPFGVNMCAPVIFTFGNEHQKKYFLPRIKDSTDWWCQGYSEPGSGSDLASLQTRAVRQGDNYIINGTKTWTTLAQWADWIFCLVRTSTEGKPQEGISFILIDMKTPGIEVTPIITMDGGHEVNSVFFSDVVVPEINLIGEENKGWTYAKFLLGFERSNSLTGGLKQQLLRLKQIAGLEKYGSRTLGEDSDFRSAIAEYEIGLKTFEFLELRTLGRKPGAEASYLKLLGTELQQQATELLLKAVGEYASPYVREALDYGNNERPFGPEYAAPLAPQYFNTRKTSIYAGSNEIQRNIMAKAVLGM